LSVTKIIERAQKTHGNRYDYSEIEYQNARTPIKIICKEHGAFTQLIMNHLKGQGCPHCPTIISSGQQEIIDYIKAIYNEEIIINTRQIIKPYELDIYIPAKKIAIEYNGLYWHSYGQQETTEERVAHSTKHNLCLEQGIQLIQILESEWETPHKQTIIKSKLKTLLGHGTRIYARKCEVVELTNQEYKKFCDNYHIQGYRGSTVKLGLKYNDELISTMSFNKHPKYNWEITRFATKFDHIVVGGASKLFDYFKKKYNPENCLTYADRRYSIGNLYRKLGFELDGITSPNYGYIKGGKIWSRQYFQKHKLAKRLEEFDPNMTESENMFKNKYRRLWDAGHYRFLLHKDKLC
jgi:hypothetical protein